MTPPLGRLSTSREGAVLIAAITGEIDMSNAATLAEAVLTRVTNDMGGLVLDLSEVEYLDSSGIHAIFRLREKLAERGQALRLVVPEHATSGDALRIAGVDTVVPASPSRAEAITAIAPDGD